MWLLSQGSVVFWGCNFKKNTATKKLSVFCFWMQIWEQSGYMLCLLLWFCMWHCNSRGWNSICACNRRVGEKKKNSMNPKVLSSLSFCSTLRFISYRDTFLSSLYGDSRPYHFSPSLKQIIVLLLKRIRSGLMTFSPKPIWVRFSQRAISIGSG